jgi:hypothetical protein
VKKLTIHAALILILVSIMGIQVTNVLYFHAHKLPDGSVVYHAHPFQKSQDQAPYKHHRHTAQEFFFYNHIQLVINTIAFLFLIAFLIPFIQQIPLFRERHLAGYAVGFPLPRPPPLA